MDWHPLIVHFPVALIVAAVLLDWGGLISRRADLRSAALVIFVAGALTTIPSALTGESSAENAERIEGIADDLTHHQDISTLVAWLSAALTVVRIHLTVKHRVEGRPGLYWLLAASACALLVLYSGYTGGVLVHRYGAGTLLAPTP